MEVREHVAITEKELRRPFYYSRWYNCANRQCKTSLVMPDEFRVFKNTAADRARAARGHADLDSQYQNAVDRDDIRVTHGELFHEVDTDELPF
jgi:hypothetical protein